MYKLFNKVYKFVAYGDFDFRIFLYDLMRIASIWIITSFLVIPTTYLLTFEFNIDIPYKWYMLFGQFCIELVIYKVIMNYIGWLESEEEKIKEKYEYLGKTGAWYNVRFYILSGYTDDDYIKLNEKARKDVVKYQQDRLNKGEIKTLSEFKRVVKDLNINESDFVNTEHLH